MKARVIEAPGMSPLWLRHIDYGRIDRLSKQLGVSEGEVIQKALEWYEDCITIADKLNEIDGGGVDGLGGRGETIG